MFQGLGRELHPKQEGGLLGHRDPKNKNLGGITLVGEVWGQVMHLRRVRRT